MFYINCIAYYKLYQTTYFTIAQLKFTASSEVKMIKSTISNKGFTKSTTINYLKTNLSLLYAVKSRLILFNTKTNKEFLQHYIAVVERALNSLLKSATKPVKKKRK